VISREKQRWVTGVFFFLAGILAATWSSRIPDVQHKLALNDAAWGTVLVAMPIGLVAGMLVSSWLVTRFGPKKITIVSCFTACLVLALLGWTNHRIQLMVALFFVGFVRTILNISVNTTSVEVQLLYQKPIISTFHGVWSLACFIAAGIGTLMIIGGYSTGFHFTAVALICLILAIIYRPKGPPLQRITERRPFLVKPDRELWLLGIIAFCAMLAENTMFDWSINYFQRVVTTDRQFSTAGYTSFIVMMSLGRLFGDRLIHAFGQFRMMVINGLLMAAGFLIIALFPSLFLSILGFLMVGLGDSILVPIVYSIAGKSKKMPPAYAIASVTLIGYTGFLSGPLLVGTISDLLNIQWAFGLVGVLAFLVPLMAIVMKKMN
jgi:MFS family permease